MMVVKSSPSGPNVQAKFENHCSRDSGADGFFVAFLGYVEHPVTCLA